MNDPCLSTSVQPSPSQVASTSSDYSENDAIHKALSAIQLPNNVDERTVQELLIHFHCFLRLTGLHNVADLLKHELDKDGIVPARINIDGRHRRQTVDDFLSKAAPFSTDLLQLLSRVKSLANPTLPPSLSTAKVRLFTSKRNNLARPASSGIQFTHWTDLNLTRPKLDKLEKIPKMCVVGARELGLLAPNRCLISKSSLAGLNSHGRYLGHLTQVFCVAFDRTGRYVITGGDDKLIKVWDTASGLLRYTFRGHQGEIADISVNAENTCLASGSTDKTVRVWSLKDGKPLMIFKDHKAMIMAIHFLPFCDGEYRYLVSSSQDCMVVFYRYEASTLFFDDTPYQFEERAMSGAKMVASSYSSGGSFVITGGTEKLVYMYHVTAECVQRVYEFTVHTDKIESLVWANNNFRFASGSKDGTAKVWTLHGEEWKATEMILPKNIEEQVQSQQNQHVVTTSSGNQKKAFKLNMLCWSHDDLRVISIGNDYILRISCWKTGQLLQKLSGHTQNAYVIKTHPVHDDVLVSAGHDGMVVLWDMRRGEKIWQYTNRDDFTQLPIPVYDLSIRPDGDLIAFVDGHGLLSLYGLGENTAACGRPKHQFFNTDYEEIVIGANGLALDLAGRPVHLPEEPPYYVNVEGAPYTDDVQRLIAGRDERSVNLHPWTARTIVPPLSDSELQLDLEKRHARVLRELNDFEQAKLDKLIHVEPPVEPQQEGDGRQTHRRRMAARRREEMNEQFDRLMQRPRYVLAEQDDDDEDDSSYSEGGQSDNEQAGASSAEERENDSDFEIGESGRRNRRAANAENGDDDEEQPAQPVEPAGTATRYGRIARPPARIYDEMANSPRPRRKVRRRNPNAEEPSTVAEDYSTPDVDIDTRSSEPSPLRTRRRVRIVSESASPEPGPSGLQNLSQNPTPDTMQHHPKGESQYDKEDEDAPENTTYGEEADEVEDNDEELYEPNKSDDSYSLPSEDEIVNENAELEEVEMEMEALEERTNDRNFLVEDEELEDELSGRSTRSEEDSDEESEAEFTDEERRPRRTRRAKKAKTRKRKKAAKRNRKIETRANSSLPTTRKRKIRRGVISDLEEDEQDDVDFDLPEGLDSDYNNGENMQSDVDDSSEEWNGADCGTEEPPAYVDHEEEVEAYDELGKEEAGSEGSSNDYDGDAYKREIRGPKAKKFDEQCPDDDNHDGDTNPHRETSYRGAKVTKPRNLRSQQPTTSKQVFVDDYEEEEPSFEQSDSDDNYVEHGSKRRSVRRTRQRTKTASQPTRRSNRPHRPIKFHDDDAEDLDDLLPPSTRPLRSSRLRKRARLDSDDDHEA